MDKKYTTPEMEITEFKNEDIITTSGGTGYDGGAGYDENGDDDLFG